MKRLGFSLLFLGFIWIIYLVLFDFTAYQYTLTVYYEKSKLPEGEQISRKDSATALRNLALELKDRNRLVLLPGCLMLSGGLLAGCSSSKHGKVSTFSTKGSTSAPGS
ncbi:hypothetical protein [Pedosphaera parvula]|uniref:Uncharacterized protein n=1 Tax=Pedosphaera parvula (strain Ellin514) TaxID=320771 RepID=B9XBJ8_PEDPL|nr:hypothetical protein [Pedosphaera parvula]EEF62883.1 hypothetical protein Cflav_PD5518 [Pedosphaera parvula Ellin514]